MFLVYLRAVYMKLYHYRWLFVSLTCLKTLNINSRNYWNVGKYLFLRNSFKGTKTLFVITKSYIPVLKSYLRSNNSNICLEPNSNLPLSLQKIGKKSKVLYMQHYTYICYMSQFYKRTGACVVGFSVYHYFLYSYLGQGLSRNIIIQTLYIIWIGENKSWKLRNFRNLK